MCGRLIEGGAYFIQREANEILILFGVGLREFSSKTRKKIVILKKL